MTENMKALSNICNSFINGDDTLHQIGKAKDKLKSKAKYLKIYSHIVNMFGDFEDANISIIISNSVKDIACVKQYLNELGLTLDFKILMSHNFITKYNNDNNFSIKVNHFTKPYLNNLNIKMDNDTLGILMFLHELGHIKMDILDYDMYDNKLSSVTKLQENAFSLFTNMNQSVYELNFAELYADNFAYINFPYVYKKLKEDKLIE